MERIEVWVAYGDNGGGMGKGPVIAYCSTHSQGEMVLLSIDQH